MIHPKMRLDEIRQTNPVIEKLVVLIRPQQFGRESGLVKNPPELVLRMRVIGAALSRDRAGSGAAKDDVKIVFQNIVKDVTQRYWLAHRMRAIHSISPLASVRSA